ncbi:hypothetical protein ACFQ60_17695 [Streptomyces zhihengii]
MALVVSLVIAVSMGLLSGLVMVPAAEQLRSLRGGERAQGVLHKGGSCMVGHCQVAFEAGGAPWWRICPRAAVGASTPWVPR